MRTVLIGNRSHPAYEAIATALDASGTFYGPPDVETGDRVAVLLGYDDVGAAEGHLAATELPRDIEVLLVHPDYGRGTSYAESCSRAAAKLDASTILRHAPATELLLQSRTGVRTTGMLSLAMRAAIPFVGWTDVSEAVIHWAREGGPPELTLHGPRHCSGQALAQDLSRLLTETLDPKTFTQLRMREMDTEGKGLVEAKKVIQFLTAMGTPREEAEQMVLAADHDQDGMLNTAEFAAGLEELLEDTLARVPRSVEYSPQPPAVIRQQWAQKGVPYRRVAAQSEHIMQTDSVSATATLRGELDPLDVLRTHALSFVNLFILPGRGLLTMHETYFGDPDYQTLRWRPSDELLTKPTTVSRLQTIDGSELHTRRTRDGSAIEARWAVIGETEMIAFNQGEDTRILELCEGKLIGLACRGPWDGLSRVMGDLFRQRPLEIWERALFRELGTLEPDKANDAGEADEVICACAGVRRSTLLEVIEQGCRSLPQIVDRTGATAICGGCTPVVEEMLGSPKLHVAEVVALDHVGDRFVRLRVVPVERPPVASLAGQHVVLQGRIEGRWVTRAYTLVNAAARVGPYEVMVKREDQGLFSGWLADKATRESLLRVSEPAGEYHLKEDDQGPFLMLAGGIGITPGIALARTLANDPQGRPLHIDWSARNHVDFIFEGELNTLSQQHEHITWTRRCTSDSERLSAEFVEERYRYEPGMVAFLCGPEPFLDSARGYLRGVGWPESAIRIEVFSSNVNDEGEVLDIKSTATSGDASEPTGDQTRVQHDSFFLDQSGRWPIMREAELALTQIYNETGRAGALRERLEEVRKEVAATGTYTHTIEELTYGSRLAWRNSSRCIGRFFWEGLQFRDMRHLQTEEEMFESILEHLRIATNGGDLLSVLTIFRPGPPTIRLYNSQLIRYAGYRQADGSFIGDPANAEMTEIAMELGWRGEGTHFDVLPIIIRIGDAPPKWFPLPRTPEICLEVKIEHPTLPWFADLGLQWYAVPAVAEMALDLGGVQYRAAPFNGFYMGTELGSRNFSDTDRYNMLPIIADRMGIDRTQHHALWRDRAMTELNTAVLYSYQKNGVRMQDHHSMGEYFHEFEKMEKNAGREVYGDWSWLVPPTAGSASPLFFRADLRNKVLKPMYSYQGKAWEADQPPPDHEGPVPPCPLHARRSRTSPVTSSVVSSPAFSEPRPERTPPPAPTKPPSAPPSERPEFAKTLVATHQKEFDRLALPSTSMVGAIIEELDLLDDDMEEMTGSFDRKDQPSEPKPSATSAGRTEPSPHFINPPKVALAPAEQPKEPDEPEHFDRTMVAPTVPKTPYDDDDYEALDRTMVAPMPKAPSGPTAAADTGNAVAAVRLVMLGTRGEAIAEQSIAAWSFLDLGRQPGQPWPEDPHKEAVHARIFPTEGGVVVDDFGRPTGVYTPVFNTVGLQDGDDIKVVQARLVLRLLTGVPGAWGQLTIYRVPSASPEAVVLERDVITIGREDADVTLDDPFVSAGHCRIIREGKALYLEDTGSAYGTYIRVRPGQPVAFGQMLLVGETLLRVLPP